MFWPTKTSRNNLLEKTNNLPKELYNEIKKKSIEAGLYACNMPTEHGGGGLNAFDLTLVEKHLGFASLALAEIAWRPQNILMACEGELVDEYLKPAITGERKDCIAMTEPGAGSDLRGMKTKAVKDGNDWIINGTKHFISNAHISDFVVLFASTGEDDKGRNLLSCFLVDLKQPHLPRSSIMSHTQINLNLYPSLRLLLSCSSLY